MNARILALTLVLVVALGLAACSSDGEPGTDTGGAAGDAAGLRLAPGWHEMEDGTVQVIGTLEYVDLEGGFYAVTDGAGETFAVINNENGFATDLQALLGRQVSVTGARIDGMSIRMAGPEVIVEAIDEISDTPGAAE
jgi:hypothetical protein